MKERGINMRIALFLYHGWENEAYTCAGLISLLGWTTSDVSETTCRRNERLSNQPHSFNNFSSSGYSLVSCFVFNPNLVPRVLSYTFLRSERERRVGERTRERGWFNPSNSHLRRRRSGQSDWYLFSLRTLLEESFPARAREERRGGR